MKVSIITVCLNSAEAIEDCIESVSKQTHPDIEHIIIDGSSTDGTVEIINTHKDKIFKFVSEPDDGIYNAMNKGIKVSRGDVVTTLNSDDMYASRNIVHQMSEFIEKHKFDAAYGDLVYVDRDNIEKVTRYWKAGYYQKGAFRYGWTPPHPTFFCRRGLFEKYGFFDRRFKIAADFELMLRFIEKNRIKFGYLPKVIVKMRRGGRANILNGIIRGNLEIMKSFRLNNICFPPLFFAHKLITKISQLFKRPRLLL